MWRADCDLKKSNSKHRSYYTTEILEEVEMPEKEKPDHAEKPRREESTGDDDGEVNDESDMETETADSDLPGWTKRFPPKPKR